MDAIHPNLTHGTSLKDLDAAIDALAASVDGASDDEVMVGVMRIAAMVSADGRDGHTGVFVWGTGGYPVESLPLRLWLFEDEVVIVDALPPYEDLVDATVVSIQGRPIADVLTAVDPLIPRDNDQTVRLLAPRFLLIPEVLRGLGIGGDGPIALGVTLPSRAADVRLVEPIPIAEYNGWAGPYGLHLPTDAGVLSLANMDEALWWDVLPDTRTLYVQYNRVEPQPPAVLDALGTALGDPAIEGVVLDVRHNYGGDVGALDAIQGLISSAAAALPREVFVITGRNTFSAASLLVARLDAEADVTIVGEAMGGAPTSYGDPSELRLSYSQLVVTVSGLLEVGVDKDDPRLTIEPDEPATLTHEAWRDRIDPALERVIVVAP